MTVARRAEQVVRRNRIKLDGFELSGVLSLLERYEALQFLVEVLHDDDLRGRGGLIRVTALRVPGVSGIGVSSWRWFNPE